MLKKYGVWILFIIIFILPIILVSLYVIISGADYLDSDFFKSPGFALVIVGSHTLSFLILIYFLKKLNLTLKDIGWELMGKMDILREVGIGFVLSLFIYIFKEIALDSLSAILHGHNPTFQSFFNFSLNAEEVALLLIAFVFPFVEESIFRGFPYQQWRTKMPVWKIILITSVVFGLMHTLGGERDLTSAIDTGIIGAIYFLIFYWRKNLYCSSSAHSFYNLWIVLT